jgi:gamma-glutamyltranspeptidase/glutathione hydrolase
VPVLAAGAAGSRRITSSILQTISGVIDRGLPVQDAVASPRIHSLASRRVWIEAPAATQRLLNSLSTLFREVRIKPALSFKMGAIQAIQFHQNGSATGAADPRRDGVATSLVADKGQTT